MHFGRIEGADQRSENRPPLPTDRPRTEKLLSLLKTAAMPPSTEVYVGCPIWASRAWLGSLYPKGTKPGDFLNVYVNYFRTVEVNSTFYQLLPGDRIALWRDQTGGDFRFCPKVFRGITENLAGPELPTLVKTYCEAIAAFEDRLGLAFAQFPESFGPKLAPLLARFLDRWPREIPLSVELRHPDWFRDHALLDEAVNLLYRHRVATVITDTPGRPDVLHLSLTQPKVLIRLQGGGGPETDEGRLGEWAERIEKWRLSHLEEIYFITHQPGDETIADTALLAREKILGIPRPTPEGQIELGI